MVDLEDDLMQPDSSFESVPLKSLSGAENKKLMKKVRKMFTSDKDLVLVRIPASMDFEQLESVEIPEKECKGLIELDGELVLSENRAIERDGLVPIYPDLKNDEMRIGRPITRMFTITQKIQVPEFSFKEERKRKRSKDSKKSKKKKQK